MKLLENKENICPAACKNKRKTDYFKYCWTHGSCSHIGAEFNNPVKGHKKEAILKNSVVGSNFRMRDKRV